ncbi:MAG: response regulator transcription factor [Coriobacteriia bacterium]|nr:response regulator transcription factor [Coriobacteriia bacterium]
MHMRRAMLVSDDVHTLAWVRQALSKLDLAITEAHAKDLASRLTEADVELVVIDGGRTPEPLAQAVENAAAEGLDVRLMIVLEPEALASLRLPTRLKSDFFVRGGASDELVARVRALMWPGEEATTQELVRVAHLTVNLATYQAYEHGTPIDFTYLEYALFAFLVTHPDRAYSREVLLRRVWGTDYYGGSRTVDVHVRRIRSKIGAELSDRLETVRNVGYLWRG